MYLPSRTQNAPCRRDPVAAAGAVPTCEHARVLDPTFDCDVAVIGSGFGGAATALRLAEKGYEVVVLEQGRRVVGRDILRARGSLRRRLWAPRAGLRGFFWQRIFRDVGIIGGTGVGGGSIVWGAVLLRPGERFYRDPAWTDLVEDWREELAPHYGSAERMLGRVMNEALTDQDEHLRAVAERFGAGHTFGPVPLAIHFGDGPGAVTADPFFGGEGPSRTGCRLCGGCLAGCPYGAKNTLDLNYLWLAERRGVRIRPETRVTALAPLPGGGYELSTRHPWRRGERGRLRARRVVLAAGVLGTLELLFRCRDELGTLPHVSARLGERVRTNSEAVTGVLAGDPQAKLLDGPSITSDFHPDAETHVTQNRFAGGGILVRGQLGPLVDGDEPRRRRRATLAAIARRPLAQARIGAARHFEQRYTALTVMQHVDNELRLRLGRSPVAPWRRALRSARVDGAGAPSYLPVANAVAREFARVSGGRPLNLLAESVGGLSFTAHILGGAVMGATAADGVVDASHEVHGHPGLFVADASAIPANLGVNPSLTITALAERFAALWPLRADAAELPPRCAPAPLPASLPGLAARWRSLTAPESLGGDTEASFVGPLWLRAAAPLALRLLGLAGWCGKRFGGDGTGVNLHRGGRTGLPLRAAADRSVLDGRPCVAITYGRDAPLPWRRVRDELRALDGGSLLAMSVVDVPVLRRVGFPFVLRRPHA